MKFKDWEPLYKQIINDFKFKMEDDIKSRDTLADLLTTRKSVKINELKKMLENKKVYIFGANSTLGDEVKTFYDEIYDPKEKEIVTIAADGATTGFIENDRCPDIIVSDLDGFIPHQQEANEKGSIMLIHAHGDNIPALKKWLPGFSGSVLGTTQAKPVEKKKVYNFGGFTDGDRAVYLAAHFKARLINLVAFEFTQIGKYSYNYDPKTKFRKLTWANLLIGILDEPPIVFLPTVGEEGQGEDVTV